MRRSLIASAVIGLVVDPPACADLDRRIGLARSVPV
jgi:hypothetical protein